MIIVLNMSRIICWIIKEFQKGLEVEQFQYGLFSQETACVLTGQHASAPCVHHRRVQGYSWTFFEICYFQNLKLIWLCKLKSHSATWRCLEWAILAQKFTFKNFASAFVICRIDGNLDSANRKWFFSLRAPSVTLVELFVCRRRTSQHLPVVSYLLKMQKIDG